MKKLFAMLLVFLFVFSFAACGSQTSTETDSTAEPEVESESENAESENAESEAAEAEPVEDVASEEEPAEPDATESIVYNAVDGFSAETCEGDIWQYGYTTDGYSFTIADHYDSPDYDGDGEADVSEWYGPAGTGVGINFDNPTYIEVNNNGAGECAGIGFKAPADGTYVFSGTTWNQYEQESSGMLMNCWDSQLEIIPFTVEEQSFEYEVSISAGTIVWFWVADEYSWVSAYMTLNVTAE